MRPPTDADAALVAALASAVAPERLDAERIRRGWTTPGFNPETDAVLTQQSYADIQLLGDDRAWLSLYGAADDELIRWAQERARERGARRAFAGVWGNGSDVHAALERAGFGLVRHAYVMRIELDRATAEPEWPQGFTVRSFRPGDERAFFDVHQETFEDSWEHVPWTFEEWTHWLLDSPAFHPETWFLAEAGGEIAGIVVSHPHATNAELGWIAIVGVRRRFRRRGLARGLLLHTFAEFRRRGFRAAGLGVDADSLTGANRLYESAGMQVVGRHDIFEKRL